ncbi:recombinase family protein [Salipiger mucosus]|uniref:Resolvase n=1 Tax=Salipiger mucosus DSM 16094 TaxID=1123237 RepID=S9RNU9_9RHOB|nr:recombinase family protein [Salipiger mucosus]EPX75644.1 Resolvase [Salipiger mucosus DSM 16094]
MKYGYRRVSSVDQKLDRQILPAEISEANVFEEKISGARGTNRPELENVLGRLRPGDELHVYSTDRLARSTRDLLDIVERVKAVGAVLIFEKERLTFSGDNADPMSDFMLTMLGALAEMERANIRARQLEGIEIAKSRGKYRGGRKRLDRKAVWKLLDAGFGPQEVADTLRIGVASVYRIRKEGRSMASAP